MNNEPLAAGARLHSMASEERAKEPTLEDILGDDYFDGGYIEEDPEESTPPPSQPSAAPAACEPIFEINEATEIAANALISMHCQLCGEPNMALTGSVRIVIYKMAKALGGQGDMTHALAQLRAVSEAFNAPT